jgi:hypothetical protein
MEFTIGATWAGVSADEPTATGDVAIAAAVGCAAGAIMPDAVVGAVSALLGAVVANAATLEGFTVKFEGKPGPALRMRLPPAPVV